PMKRTILLSILASFVLPACGVSAQALPAAAPRAEAMESAPAQPAGYPMAPPSAPASASASASAGASASASASASARASASASAPAVSLHAPLVTYSGELALRVDRDPSAAIDAVITAAESLGGYLAARRDASVEVRV